jgi:hypothetical protein
MLEECLRPSMLLKDEFELPRAPETIKERNVASWNRNEL